MAEKRKDVIIGADTHKQTHVIALVSHLGQQIAEKRFDANEKGYAKALKWVYEHGLPIRAGIESTGSYGKGLCAFFQDHGIECLDVYKPDKQVRRRRGKDDVIDAYQAAQAALTYTRSAQVKEKSEKLEAAQSLESTYKLFVKHRTAQINSLKAMVVGLPDKMRKPLEELERDALVKKCATFRPTKDIGNLDGGTKLALKCLAEQILSLDKDICLLQTQIDRLAKELAPKTYALPGVGCHGVIRLLCAAGENIERMDKESSFSMLCGTSPVPASTGDRHHFRLNRGGNREANCVIHTMAISRMKQKDTKAFVEKKMSEGKTKKDAIRVLKRYLSREVYRTLRLDLYQIGVVERQRHVLSA